MSYYNDPDKITFDRAERVTDRYIRENKKRQTRVTCKEVARKYDIETSHHNLIRINEALVERLEVVRPSGAKATQYKLPEQ